MLFVILKKKIYTSTVLVDNNIFSVQARNSSPPSRSENCWFLIASKENKHFHSFSNRIKTNSCIYLLYTNNAITRITLPHLVSINWEDLEYYPTRIFNYRTKVTTPHILDSARNISAKIGFNSFSGSSGYLNYKKFMGQRLSWASKN